MVPIITAVLNAGALGLLAFFGQSQTIVTAQFLPSEITGAVAPDPSTATVVSANSIDTEVAGATAEHGTGAQGDKTTQTNPINCDAADTVAIRLEDGEGTVLRSPLSCDHLLGRETIINTADALER